MREKPILIRVAELADFTRESEFDFRLQVLKSNLVKNLVDKLPYASKKKNADINDVYVKFYDTEQTRATIELLQMFHDMFKEQGSVIYPDEGQ